MCRAGNTPHPGFAVRGLQPVADVTAHDDEFDCRVSEAAYCTAPNLAERRGMRPAVAHSHRGLSKLYESVSDGRSARKHLGIASALSGEMDIERWSARPTERPGCIRRSVSAAWIYPRRVLSAAASAVLLFAGQVAARDPDTADWPTKPVQLIINSPAGSTTDYAARIFADRLANGLGQQFVTRNRGGASGLLGIGAAVKSPADGYTFLVTAGFSVVIAPHLLRTSFDPFKDLEPVTQFIDAALLLAVHPSVATNSLQELVTFAKRNPGNLSWGTADIGSTTHLLCEAFKLQAGVDIFHVPYRSGSQGLSDFLSGVVQIHSDAGTLPHVSAGRAKLLAIVDRSRRVDFPDVPLLNEIYPELDYLPWLAVFAPTGTPRAIVHRMSEEMNKIARESEVRELLLTSALTPRPGTPGGLSVLMRKDYERYGKLLRQLKLIIE
jgi:tripartite-type tricarboxylate transporter receptor subunit TctC